MISTASNFCTYFVEIIKLCTHKSFIISRGFYLFNSLYLFQKQQHLVTKCLVIRIRWRCKNGKRKLKICQKKFFSCRFYEVNDVNAFELKKAFHKGTKDKENEFAV